MIRAFTDADLDLAAEYLAERHARHRAAEPLLPDDVDFRAQVEKEWRVDGASGVISADGYLFGAPGAHGWFVVGIGGHAVRGEVEHAQDLYTAAASCWVDAGQRSQMVFVPPHDTALVDAWFRLSFGASGVLAMRETAANDADARDVQLHIRRGTPADLDVSWRLDRELTRSMEPSPSFSTLRVRSDEDYEADWKDTWDDESYEHFVAEHDGRVVSQIVLYRRPPDLRVPKDSIDLAQAATFPEARGLGAGRALTEHVLRWAHEEGFASMTIDWRLTNLLAARFWPKRGFRTTFLRLHRCVE
jgi:ribosomal protein S18 acetylase RimI-like enzyme